MFGPAQRGCGVEFFGFGTIPMVSILHYSDWSGGYILLFYLSQRNKLLQKEDTGFEHWKNAREKIEKSVNTSRQCMPLAQRYILYHDKSFCESGANFAETMSRFGSGCIYVD